MKHCIAKSIFSVLPFYKKELLVLCAGLVCATGSALPVPDGKPELTGKKVPENRIGIDFRSLDNLIMPDNSSRNFLRNPSFETRFKDWLALNGTGIDKMPELKKHWDPANEVFSLTDKEAKFGKKSLRLRVLPGGGAPFLSQQLLLEKGTYVLSFYAKTSTPGAGVQMFFGEHSEKGRRGLAEKTDFYSCRIQQGEWQRYQHVYCFQRKGSYRLTLRAVSWDKKHGDIFLDGLQLEKGETPTPFTTQSVETELTSSASDNFIQEGKEPALALKLHCMEPHKGKVRVTIENFFRENILDKILDFSAVPGKETILPLFVDRKKAGRGIFMVCAEFQLENGKTCRTQHRFAIVQNVPLNARHRKLFAVVYGDAEATPGFVRVLQRWQKLGVGSKPHLNSWDMDVVNTYRKYGVDAEVSSIMSYFNKDGKMVGFGLAPSHNIAYWRPHRGGWWDPNADAPVPKFLIRDPKMENVPMDKTYLERFEKAAETVVRANPGLHCITLAGEIACKFPYTWWSKEGTREKYVDIYSDLLGAFVRGAKKGNPKILVYQDDPANMDPDNGIAETAELLAVCNKKGIKFDVIAIHPYRYKPEDPDLDDDTAAMLKMMDKAGYSKAPLIWPEMMHWPPYGIPQIGVTPDCKDKTGWYEGNLSYGLGWQEKVSSGWYARSFLVALKYADRVKMANAGLVSASHLDFDLTPYSCQLIPNTLGNLLGDADFRCDIRPGTTTRCYIFEDSMKRPVAAIWNFDPKIESGVQPSPVAKVDLGNFCTEAFDIMNNPRDIVTGVNQFAVTPFPLFFRGKPGTLAEMKRAFNELEFVMGGKDGMSLQISFRPCSTSKVNITLTNRLSKKLKGSFGTTEFQFDGAGKKTFQKILLPSLRADRIRNTKAAGSLQMNGQLLPYPVTFRGFSVQRLPDGTTFKNVPWDKLSEIPLEADRNNGTSGTFRIGWTPQGLFLRADIRDKVFAHKEFPRSYDRWANDCLQIFFDTSANGRDNLLLMNRKGFDDDDYSYAVFPNASCTAAKTFLYRSVDSQLGLGQAAPRPEQFISDIPSHAVRKNGVTTYIIFFPSRYLMPMQLRKGACFGFGLMALNCEDDSLPKNKRVVSTLSVLPEGGNCHNNPSRYPIAILENQ